MYVYALGVGKSDGHTRRGYGQYCAVASALDLLGERWTLLIARDLLTGPKRYTDLREGLPGIGTDLLTARLRSLEAAGLVQRRTLPRPSPATVYELTQAGEMLNPVIASLARIGFTLLGRPAADAQVPPDALVLSLNVSFRPEEGPPADAAYELLLDGDPFSVTIRDGEVRTERGRLANPDLRIDTDPLTLVRLLRGDLSPEAVTASGAVTVVGPSDAFERFLAGFRWSHQAPAEEREDSTARL